MPGFFPMQYALKPKPSPYIRTASERVVPHALRSVADKAGQNKRNQGGYAWEDKPVKDVGNLFNKRKEEDEDDPDAVQEPKKDNSCDLKTVLKMTGEHKADWLDASLWAVEQKKLKAIDVYDIVTHPKFGAGAGKRTAQRMLRYINENIFLFSVKQRDSVYNCKLFQDFGQHSKDQGAEHESDDEHRSRSRSRSRSKSPKVKRQKHHGDRNERKPMVNFEEDRIDNLIDERKRIFAELNQEAQSLPDDGMFSNAMNAMNAAMLQAQVYDPAPALATVEKLPFTTKFSLPKPNATKFSPATAINAFDAVNPLLQAPASNAASSSATPQVASQGASPSAQHQQGTGAPKSEESPKKESKAVSNILSGLLVGKLAPKVVEDPRKVTVIKTPKVPSLEALKPTRDDLTVESHRTAKYYAHASIYPVPLAPRKKQKPGAICYLCKRAFSCREMLEKHEKQSDLHKKNLDRLQRRG